MPCLINVPPGVSVGPQATWGACDIQAASVQLAGAVLCHAAHTGVIPSLCHQLRWRTHPPRRFLKRLWIRARAQTPKPHPQDSAVWDGCILGTLSRSVVSPDAGTHTSAVLIRRPGAGLHPSRPPTPLGPLHSQLEY